jgi:oxalate---CoA ligase
VIKYASQGHIAAGPQDASENVDSPLSTFDDPGTTRQQTPGAWTKDLVATAQQPEQHLDISGVSAPSMSRLRRSGNLSHQRRENEFLRVLEKLQGIAAINLKEFRDAHAALIEDMEKRNEPASGPAGIRPDKRTVDATLNKMVESGKIKVMKTSVQTPIGASRSIVVAYLQSLSQEKVTAYLRELGQNSFISQAPPTKRIQEPTVFATGREPKPQKELPLQLLQPEDGKRKSYDTKKADELFAYDNDTIRDVLLAERTTLSQFYGHIVPKAVRARELHILTIQAFNQTAQSPRIVSHEHRIIDIAYYYHDFPVFGYFAIIAALEYSESLRNIMETSQGRLMPVKDLPISLISSLGIGRARSRARLLEVLDILRALNVATPLVKSESSQPLITCPDNGYYPTAFDTLPRSSWSPEMPTKAPVFWQFHTTAPIRLWSVSKTSPPFVGNVSTVTPEDCASYWQELKEASISQDYAKSQEWSTIESISSASADVMSAKKTICRHASWSTSYVFTWHQVQYMRRALSRMLPQDLEDEEHAAGSFHSIAWVISAPVDAVQNFAVEWQEKQVRERTKAEHRARRANREAREQHRLHTKAKLAQKAKAARVQREQEWEALLQAVHPELLRGSTASRVRQVRARFLTARGQDDERWTSEIRQALQTGPFGAKSVYGTGKRPGEPSFIVIEPMAPAPPVVTSFKGPSVQSLIDQQGPPLNKVDSRKSKKGKKGDLEGALSAY